GHAKRTSSAWRGPGGDSGRAVCRAPDRERAEGAESQTSVPLFRQGQHGRCRQELRGTGAGLVAHERLPDVAGVGVRSHPLPAPGAEPTARAAPVALVVFHGSAQLAPHPRVAADAKRGTTVSGAITAGDVTDQLRMRFSPHETRAFCGVKKEVEPWISIRSCCRACSSPG